MSGNSKYSVGLDPSLTSFGAYCLHLNGGEDYHWVTQSNAKDGSDTKRVIEIAEDTIEAIANLPHPIESITFEDYGPINRTSGKIAQRAEICGIIKHYALRVLRVPVFMVSPTSLKSFATGKGNAGKPVMLSEAAKHGFFTEVSDEADAYFAARLGRSIAIGGKIGVAFHRVNPDA